MCVGKTQGPVDIPKDANHIHNDSLILLSYPRKQNVPYEHKISDGVFVSQLSDLPLVDYASFLSKLCNTGHCQPCVHCSALLKVADIILKEGVCPLRQAFELTSPGLTYDTIKARRKLLVMPLAAVRIGDPSSGVASTVLMEFFPGVNYQNIANILNAMKSSGTCNKKLDKTSVQKLLGLATSDRERECIRYALFKGSGMTQTQARREYGFENMDARALEVEACSVQAQEIRKAIDNLACVQDKAFLSTLGVLSDSDDSDSSINEDDADNLDCFHSISVEEMTDDPNDFTNSFSGIVSLEMFKSILAASKYNWFDIVERVEQSLGDSLEVNKDQLCPYLDGFLKEASLLGLGESEWQLLQQSKLAYDSASKESISDDREARAVNGEVVSDSESEDGREHYFDVSAPFTDEGKELIRKRRTAIKRQARRVTAKRLAERSFLSRKPSKHVSKVLSDCPDIGKTIENFVSSANVGADQWRRTGVLTFDGNKRLSNKVTYHRIQQHLKAVYGRNFAYGTVVQLCVARNRRRKSASRYKGVAKVTTRRARKGFTLRYNPDSHWSNCFYKGLNTLQYKDGRNLTNINRDDASGYRLDTLTTNKQYANPVVQGSDIVTTRTDYVNKYPSVLQTTSYNFSASDTTPEVCVGVVKSSGTYPKNPAQHASDLAMLDSKEELKQVFFNMWSGAPKQVECIRVDGASDEGPGHEEVQYWWTLRHIEKKRFATLVTTRSSGSSYLNRVELQNGCLSRGHANLFIPSTLGGSCIDPLTGHVNKELLSRNHHLAIDAYISRVNKSPCGDSEIALYKGSDSTDRQQTREKLLIFLKGSKKMKLKLQTEDPVIFKHFQEVWKIRSDHMVANLPQQYIFYLICCFKEDCNHPICCSGAPYDIPTTWYPGSPSLYSLPIPTLDPSKCWGSTSCPTCREFCAGHYKQDSLTDVRMLKSAVAPPSTVLKKLFTQKGQECFSDAHLEEAAKTTLLPTFEVKIWLEHLKTVVDNRRRGSEKASATRRAKKFSSKVPYHPSDHQSGVSMDSREPGEEYHCGQCGELYVEETDETEMWVACDLCDMWYHCKCEQLLNPPLSTDPYICKKCQK